MLHELCEALLEQGDILLGTSDLERIAVKPRSATPRACAA
jgi:hypothetical protein